MTYKEFSESLSDTQREFLKSQLEVMLKLIKIHFELIEMMKDNDDIESSKRDVIESIKIAKVIYDLLGGNELTELYLECIIKYLEL